MALFTSSDNTEIAYDADYTGNNCIVFLHGLGGNLTAWNPTRELLRKKGYKTLAIDLRGHGKSGRPNDKAKYNFKRIAKDVVELLEYEKISSFILVGHCFGGIISLYIASLYPRKVSKLVLINSTFKKPFGNALLSNSFSQGFFSILAKTLPRLKVNTQVNFQGYRGTADHDVKRICSDILHTSPKSYMFLLAQLLALNTHKILNTITAPTLVISSADDSVYPTRISQEMASKISNATLVVVPHENHIIVINNPEIIAEKIGEFIEK